MRAEPILTFVEWEDAVDLEIHRIAGLGLDDLPDVPTRDWFDEGVGPTEAAERTLAAAELKGNAGPAAPQ